MFRKLIVVMALLVVMTPGEAVAVQYPPTTCPECPPPTTTPTTTCPECPPPTTTPTTTCPECPPPTTTPTTTCPECPPPTPTTTCRGTTSTSTGGGGSTSTSTGGGGSTTTSTGGGGSTTTSTGGGGSTTTQPCSDDIGSGSRNGQPGRSDGRLPRTGADTIAFLVQLGVAVLVLGFVLYLVERNRRAARGQNDTELGTA